MFAVDMKCIFLLRRPNGSKRLYLVYKMEVWQACQFSSDVVLNADKYDTNTMLSILNIYPKIFWLTYCYQSYVAGWCWMP